METSGFYKLDNELMFAPNFVSAKDWELRRENKDIYLYPYFGWYWFDSEEEAQAALKIPINEINSETLY